MSVVEFGPGNYRYIPGILAYSGGVAAAAGYEIMRARFRTPVPLVQGFARIKSALEAAGRPLTAFCACELRSPAPFTEDGFRAFNAVYAGTLQSWGIVSGSTNPVARSNVCPAIDPPAEPSFHAFSFTVPASQAQASFVVAGSAEAPEGKGNYKDFIVRRGDVSRDGMREKARAVLGEMERRLGLLGFSWADTTATQVYTVHDIHPFLAEDVVRRGAARAGIDWHYCRPPVVDLEFEMDCRGISSERVLHAE